MKITQDVRELAESQGKSEEAVRAEGMQRKAAEFRNLGGEIYIEEQ